MAKTTTVDQKRERLTVLSVKVPTSWIGLMDAVASKRGCEFRSERLREVIREDIEAHFPGSTKEAA